VYVEEPEGDEMRYSGREVQLGSRAGDYYIVLSGLAEGERVVTRGNFKIDSSLQIQAKKSMMNTR
jgi:Cu(I)/Ag(I) efflux system membrane fusion protein